MMLVAGICLAAVVAEPEFRGATRGDRYGRVIVVGNTDTPDRVILGCLGVHPGQRIRFGDLSDARARLGACGVFRSNPWRGEGPTVELLPNEFDSEFWDIQVVIRERPGNWFVFGVEEMFFAAMGGYWDRAAGEFVRLVRRGCEEFSRPK